MFNHNYWYDIWQFNNGHMFDIAAAHFILLEATLDSTSWSVFRVWTTTDI